MVLTIPSPITLGAYGSIVPALLTIGGIVKKYAPKVWGRGSDWIEESRTLIIEDTIERGDKLWKSRAKKVGGEIEELDVDESPFCVECNAELARNRKRRLGLSSYVTLWECPECGEYFDHDRDEVSSVKEIVRERVGE